METELVVGSLQSLYQQLYPFPLLYFALSAAVATRRFEVLFEEVHGGCVCSKSIHDHDTNGLLFSHLKTDTILSTHKINVVVRFKGVLILDYSEILYFIGVNGSLCNWTTH